MSNPRVIAKMRERTDRVAARRTRTAEELAEQKVVDFNKKQAALQTFMEENASMMEAFRFLAQEYNEALSDAKAALRTIDAEGTSHIGPFKRTGLADKVEYDPSKVSAAVLEIPNVVKQLDAKLIEQYLESGHLTEEDVLGARKVKKQTTRVSGPKPIEVD